MCYECVCVSYLVSLFMVGVTAAAAAAALAFFFWASSRRSWLMSGEEYDRFSLDCSASPLASCSGVRGDFCLEVGGVGGGVWGTVTSGGYRCTRLVGEW